MTKTEHLTNEDLKESNLYSFASELRIILFKDYVKHVEKNVFINEHGQILEDAQKVYWEDELCAYYIPDGYKTIRCYLKPASKGISSQYKYLSKLCFDIGFLNKEAEFDNLKLFIDVLCRKYYDKKESKANRDYLFNILTLGLEKSENSDYEYSYRKYYYLKNFDVQTKRQIALSNNGKVKRSKSMDKINQAIDLLMLNDDFISYRKIAKTANLSFATINVLLNKQMKNIIKGHNREKTGYPTHNDYLRGKNEDAIIITYTYLQKNNIKPNIKTIAEHSKIYRTTVSKILKDKEFVALLNSIE